MTKTSAISSSPALLACIESPHPGFTTTTVVSAADATSTSTWPTPTVSTITTGMPAAASTRTASGTARDRPPRWPRVAIERMNTPVVEGVVLHAHPVAEDGPAGERRRRVDGQDAHLPPAASPVHRRRTSRARTTARPGLRTSAIRPSVRVDLPAPGAPVRPTV